MDPHLAAFSETRSLNISGLDQAIKRTDRELAAFRESLEKTFPPVSTPQIDVGLTGSFARREVTFGSDCDYLVVVNETVDPLTVSRFVSQMDQLREERQYGSPGAQGIFGDFVTANELLQRIGLEGDSNTNHTRRMLLLNESVSIYQPPLRAQIIKQIAERYCIDYAPEHRDDDDGPHVPRFLLNDVVRYWRTVAVDFGAKQLRALSRGSYLRYAKLLTTRKVLFAGVLASLLRAKIVIGPGPDIHARMLDYLRDESDRSPIARLVSLSGCVGEEAQQALGIIAERYSRFVEILDDRNTRTILARPSPPAGSKEETLRQEIEQLGEEIQSNLEVVFFGDDNIKPLTHRYGLF